ncbi:MAG: MarR family winged helix-turn-helix transcriptional regulator [Candidatus Gallimonas sp.]
MQNRFENFTITILKLNKLVQKIKLIEMQGYGLKAIHVMCLYYLNERREGVTASELAKLTLEDKGAISRALGQLRQKGFVRYDPGAYNEPITLTEEGERASAYVLEKAARAVDAAGGGLTEEERENFYRSLCSISERLDGYYRNLKAERAFPEGGKL